MLKNIVPLLIVLAVIFSGVMGIFLLSNQKSQPSTDINFNPTPILSPTISPANGIIISPTQGPVEQKSKQLNMNDFKVTADGLRIQDEATGSGKEVKSGDTVTVNYLGTLANGTKFDSSYDRNAPFTTQIGVGQVIKGWDEGIIGMKVGGKRILVVPPDLGYGQQAAGSIPPNSTLIFEVELLGVK